MRYCFALCASLLLILCACSRSGDAGDAGDDGSATVEPPEEIVESGAESESEIVLDLGFDPDTAPPLPDFVDHATTVDDLRTQAVITVEHEIDSHRLSREEAESRLAQIMEVWTAQMEEVHRRYRRAKAEKDAIAAYQMGEARIIDEWQTGNRRIEADMERKTREAETRQIRLISEATYRSLTNLGRSPGCRYPVRGGER